MKAYDMTNDLSKALSEITALRSALAQVEQEREHWRITADAYANQNMAAEDLSGIHGNADDIVRNLLEQRDDYRQERDTLAQRNAAQALTIHNKREAWFAEKQRAEKAETELVALRAAVERLTQQLQELEQEKFNA